MPGVRKLIVARPGFDIRTAEPRNLAFSSNYNLGKIVKVKKLTSEAAHGIPYTPRIMAMREPVSGKFGWGGVCAVNGTKLKPTLGGDVAVWAYVFIDPLVAGSHKKDMTGRPVLVVGDVEGDDHKKEIHSNYDTFKVHSTGRLTIDAPEYDPGPSGGVKTTTATVNHGLGYVPMFAPFVPYETEREAYLSWNSQYNSEMWTSGRTFYTGQEAVDEGTWEWYVCKLTHTSSSDNKPGSGANWTIYWDVYVEPDYYDTYVNKLEDQKYIYGGVEAFNLSYIRYYATSTQLVLELAQDCYPDSPPGYEYTPCPAEKVYVDYTIFYNRADSEFSLI